MGKSKGSLNIYFCGSICGGRADQELYSRIIAHLKTYGTVLTEGIGRADLTDQGNGAARRGVERAVAQAHSTRGWEREVSPPSHTRHAGRRQRGWAGWGGLGKGGVGPGRGGAGWAGKSAVGKGGVGQGRLGKVGWGMVRWGGLVKSIVGWVMWGGGPVGGVVSDWCRVR